MACACNQPPGGRTFVYKLITATGTTEYDSEAAARAARTRAGGKGTIARTTKGS
jgi:flavin-binding protein dodecin